MTESYPLLHAHKLDNDGSVAVLSLQYQPMNVGYVLRLANILVYQLLGESGTYYGVRFGKKIPWVTEFPFDYIKDPQYVGSMLSLVALLCWVPFQYVLLWCLVYVLMIWVENKEDPATRSKPLS
ncbi:phosphatidyl-N-methylethanolamine N-methyltransferase-like [Phragmites australis]|uniref:phosphatidyl-N-methylethanolamine N-methyltransferase-like n=1 Tax=Phragmites australis TaxID=29695 RepID=UPI002D774B24|nr:phosphatidyl-N-methylethanolamine N-methyltransferase-like [Phragmites australis]